MRRNMTRLGKNCTGKNSIASQINHASLLWHHICLFLYLSVCMTWLSQHRFCTTASIFTKSLESSIKICMGLIFGPCTRLFYLSFKIAFFSALARSNACERTKVHEHKGNVSAYPSWNVVCRIFKRQWKSCLIPFHGLCHISVSFPQWSTCEVALILARTHRRSPVELLAAKTQAWAKQKSSHWGATDTELCRTSIFFELFPDTCTHPEVKKKEHLPDVIVWLFCCDQMALGYSKT